MNWNIVGMVASLTEDAGMNLQSDVPYCDPSINPVCVSYGGGGPVLYPNDYTPTPLPSPTPTPVTLNPAPVLDPTQDIVPLPQPGSGSTTTNTPVNNLPTSNPGPLTTVVNTPIQQAPPTVPQVAKANPWLIGLLLAGGIYYAKKKKYI